MCLKFNLLRSYFYCYIYVECIHFSHYTSMCNTNRFEIFYLNCKILPYRSTSFAGEIDSDGFYRGYIAGKSARHGLVPSNYLQEISSNSQATSPQCCHYQLTFVGMQLIFFTLCIFVFPKKQQIHCISDRHVCVALQIRCYFHDMLIMLQIIVFFAFFYAIFLSALREIAHIVILTSMVLVFVLSVSNYAFGF